MDCYRFVLKQGQQSYMPCYEYAHDAICCYLLPSLESAHQKRIFAIIGVVAALVGASSVSFLATIQPAQAAKCAGPIVGVNNACFCYPDSFGFVCFTNNGECMKAQASDPIAKGSCFNAAKSFGR